MKKKHIVLGFLWVSACIATAQSRISAGETWSYQFNSLPFVGIDSSPFGGIWPPNGGANVILSNVDPGSHYTFSLYENSLSDTPIWVSDSLNYPNNQSISAGGVAIWQDLQGWAQLQVISGAVTIDEIEFDARIPIDSYSDNWYQSIIAVPEPGSGALLMLAAGLVGSISVGKRRRG